MRKRFLAVCLALALCLGLMPTAAFAADEEFDIQDGVLLHYRGPGGDVVIPDGVTQIGGEYKWWGNYYCPFYNNRDVTSVTIPNSVTKIYKEAFWGCTNLTSVSIPNSVTEIGNSAFQKCTGLTSVTIPNSVTNAGVGAFCYCTSLTSVTIGNGATEIGSGMFTGCTSLTDVFVGNSVARIGMEAFSGCTSLTNVDMDNSSITYVGKDAFKDTRWLKNQGDFLIAGKHLFGYQGKGGAVTIPSGITTIGDSVFNRADITSITIPFGVTEIGSEAFAYCNNLTDVTIPNSVTYIRAKAFYECNKLTDVAIPNSVTYIGDEAFYRCSMTDVTIPGSVTSIGTGAFKGCGSLTSVTFENGVTEINSSLFESCPRLAYVVIPTSVTEIGGSSFYGCKKLTDIYYAGTQEQWKEIDIYYTWKSFDFTRATVHYNSAGPCKAHSYDDGIVTTPATCIAEGVMTYTCVFCNETRTESIDKVDHTPGDAVGNGNGTHSTKCAVCRQAISTDACTYDNGVVTKQPTITAQGEMTYTCTVCGEIKTEAIPRLDDPKKKFTDLSPTGYYLDAVAWALDNNITTGTTATTFSPDQTCTHAQILTFLWRAAGKPASSAALPVDITGKNVDWAADALRWAAEKGMIGADFNPSAPCTRAYAVLYIWQAFGKPAPSTASPFTDVPAHWSSAPAAAWAAEQGITTGTSATTFTPGQICTRGQIVTFLYRAYK